MYESKNLLPAHGRLKINVIFTKKDGSKYVETGFAQSVNVKNRIGQMMEEATLNAFYKLNHRLGEKIFNKNNYAEDLSEYVSKIHITSYNLKYYEDRIYSYKRESVNGKYQYVIRLTRLVSSAL